MPTDKTPDIRRVEGTVPAAAAGAAQDQTIGEAHFGGIIHSVSIVPEANIVAHAANYRTFRVINKGADGNGSTVVATFATDTVSTDDMSDFDEKHLPLSGTPADLVVAQGDVLAIDETVTGTGVAHSGYKVIVEVARS